MATAETIHTTSVDMGVAVIRRLRELFGTPLEGPRAFRSSTQDMKRVFRQIPICHEDQPFHVIAVYSLRRRQMALWSPPRPRIRPRRCCFGVQSRAHLSHRTC